MNAGDPITLIQSENQVSRISIALAALCAVFQLPQLSADIIDPNTEIGGLSQLEHSGLWWTNFLNIPASENPLIDPTDQFMFQGQAGSIYYVPGLFGPPPTNRAVTVNAGSTIFLNLLNFIGEDVSSPANIAAGGLAPEFIEELFLEIDGVSVATTSDLLLHRQLADENNTFDLVIDSPENLYVDLGLDPTGTGDPNNPNNYPVTLDAVLDGYWVALEPFAPGSVRTIRFGGSTLPPDSFSQDNTLVIYTVPEPTSATICGSIFAVGMLRRRRPK